MEIKYRNSRIVLCFYLINNYYYIFYIEISHSIEKCLLLHMLFKISGKYFLHTIFFFLVLVSLSKIILFDYQN